jgi:hypothetical protein
MKKSILKYIGILVFVVGVSTVFAQTPPPPNNGDTSGGGNTPVGGGAPVGGGLAILIAMSSAYGYSRFRKMNNE